MKLCITFFLLLSFNSSAQIDSNKILAEEIYMISGVTSIHFSGDFGKLRSSGHISSDSLGNRIWMTNHCWDPEDSTVLYYSLTLYFTTGTISYDSIVDLRSKRIGKSTVKEYNDNGTKMRSLSVRAKLDPKRKDIPKRSETKWSGKEVLYDENGHKLVKEKIKEQVY